MTDYDRIEREVQPFIDSTRRFIAQYYEKGFMLNREYGFQVAEEHMKKLPEEIDRLINGSKFPLRIRHSDVKEEGHSKEELEEMRLKRTLLLNGVADAIEQPMPIGQSGIEIPMHITRDYLKNLAMELRVGFSQMFPDTPVAGQG